jgi:hypothetical protein
MKNAVFCDVVPCGFIINRHFRGMCRLHLQGRRNNTSEEKRLMVAKTGYSSERENLRRGEIGCGKVRSMVNYEGGWRGI